MTRYTVFLMNDNDDVIATFDDIVSEAEGIKVLVMCVEHGVGVTYGTLVQSVHGDHWTDVQEIARVGEPAIGA